MLAAGHCAANETVVPFRVSEALFDQTQEETLGLEFAPGTETHTVYRPSGDQFLFNHGAVLMPFRGQLYAQWQSSDRDEDAPDTQVFYSVSKDGSTWQNPRVLAPAFEGGHRSNGGWWTDGKVLVAYISSWPDIEGSPKSGFTEYMTSGDGHHWSEPKPLRDAQGQPLGGIIEQDPHALPDGRIINAFHQPPGLVAAPYFTDDPKGLTGWTRGQMQNLPYEGDISRELEPSWFVRADAGIVMVFRDQAGSFKKLASVSHDRGVTWTTPVLVNMPDSRSKQSAGNLPDGQAYLVGNPTQDRRRFPLVVTLSETGELFDRAFLLRAGGADMQARRYEGKYKRAGFSYPKSVVWKDHLYVSYATNKEDIQITRIPLTSLSHR